MRGPILAMLLLGVSATSVWADDSAPTPKSREQLVALAKMRIEIHARRLEATRELGKLEVETRKRAARQSVAKLDVLKARLTAHEAEVAHATASLGRLEGLFQRGAASQRDLQDAKLSVAQSRAARTEAAGQIKLVDERLSDGELAVRRAELEAMLRTSEAELDLLNAKTALAELLAE